MAQYSRLKVLTTMIETGMVAPTMLGMVFVIGQALAVLALGALQFLALRRPQALLV